jgi:DNA-binding GntR family transcriptional regulator
VTIALTATNPGNSLVDFVAGTLRQAILQGQYPCGERLDLGAIVDSLQVSRTPLREALHRLEAEGIVEIRAHRGVYVVLASPRDVAEILDVRIILEPEIIRRVTAAISCEELEELAARLDSAQTDHAAGKIASLSSINMYFHKELIGLLDNAVLKAFMLEEVLSGLGGRIYAVRRFTALQPGSHSNASFAEHLEIMEAMRRRDCDRAGALMKSHLEAASQRLQAVARTAYQRADGSLRASPL